MLSSLWVTNEVNDGCCSKYSNSQRPPIPDAIKCGSHMNVGYQNCLNKEVKESREIKKKEEEEARRIAAVFFFAEKGTGSDVTLPETAGELAGSETLHCDKPLTGKERAVSSTMF